MDRQAGESLTMQVPQEETLQHTLLGKRTGEILIEMGALSPEQLEEALAEQRVTHKRLGEIALEKGWVAKPDLLRALARRLGVEYVDIHSAKLDPVASDLISQRDARRYSALPVSFVNEHTILVAMADPSNIVAIDDLRILTGFDIEPAVADPDDILAALAKLKASDEQVSEQLSMRTSETEEEPTHEEMRDIREQVDAAPVVKLVNGTWPVRPTRAHPTSISNRRPRRCWCGSGTTAFFTRR